MSVANTSEFIHVSEFYETILGLGFLMLFLAQLTAVVKGFYGALSKLREKEDE
jgi:Na+-transporting methylmalonyl-CoA/oxaloacetate decarboxylase gamma subunit